MVDDAPGLAEAGWKFGVLCSFKGSLKESFKGSFRGFYKGA